MEHLYMFAIMPPAELAARIHTERQNFAEQYKCVKALKPPVHITLYPPFKHADGLEDTIKGIRNWASLQTKFPVELKNFNFFKNRNSPVIYIDVVANDHLKKLHNEFLDQLKKYMPVERPDKYTPHITIGYRDVPPAIFPEIVKAYSPRRFSAAFDVSSIYLWRHDGKNWQVQQEYTFGTDNQLF
jgi:2'-5' RNA ligase